MHWEIRFSRLSLQRYWAGLCGCRYLAQGNGHLQGDGCMTASIPGELCIWGAQLLGPQDMHCVRACEMCVDERECPAPTRQGGQTGRGDIAWVVSSSSANRSTRHTARSNFTGFHCIKFMLVNVFPCCQFSKVCSKPALSPRKLGVVSEAGNNTSKLLVPNG